MVCLGVSAYMANCYEDIDLLLRELKMDSPPSHRQPLPEGAPTSALPSKTSVSVCDLFLKTCAHTF